MTPRFPTITAPLPTDPRVISLASSAAMPRREAYAAAVEVWQWLAAMADGITVPADVDAVDAVVDCEGFGKRMLEAQLIGTADGLIVLPEELRQKPTARGADAVRPLEETPDDRRRRKNREAQQRRRNELRLMGAKPRRRKTPPREKRSLGQLAGCEVIASDGPYGVFAMLSGAIPEVIKAGEKHWDIKTLTLADVAPSLLAKLRKLDSPSQNALAPDAGRRAFKPSADELQTAVDALVSGSTDDTDRMTHDDMSAPVIARQQTSSLCHQSVSKTSSFSAIKNAPNPNVSKGLGDADMSLHRYDDAPSSSLLLISSSSSEEEKQKDDKQRHRETLVARFAAAINTTTSHVWELLRGGSAGKSELSRRLRDAGVDSKTGLPLVTPTARPSDDVPTANLGAGAQKPPSAAKADFAAGGKKPSPAASPPPDDDFHNRKTAAMRLLADAAAADAAVGPIRAPESPIGTDTSVQTSTNEQPTSGPLGPSDAIGGKPDADGQRPESGSSGGAGDLGDDASHDASQLGPAIIADDSQPTGPRGKSPQNGDLGPAASADGPQPTAAIDITIADAGADARDDAGGNANLQEDLPSSVGWTHGH